jgi:EpsI family protein
MSGTVETHPSRGLGAPSRRDLMIGGLLTAGAIVAQIRKPTEKIASIRPGQLERIVPLTIGPWHYQSASGIVLPPPDALAQMLYDQQLSRAYGSSSDLPVMLVMAYGSGQNGALQVHRPEICYPASGYRLTRTEHYDLPLANGKKLPARTFTAESDTRVEQVLYWSRIADFLPTGWTDQRIAIMRENLAGYIPDGLLVRVSIASDDRDAAMAALERFCRTLLAVAGAVGRHQLVGADYA